MIRSLSLHLLLGALSEEKAEDEVDVEVKVGDVQDHIKGDGPAQAPPNIIATLVLQDTLACMLGLLEGMAHAGTFNVTSNAPHTRVGGQTPDPMVAPDSQNPKIQLAAVVALRLDSIELTGIASHLANMPSMNKVVNATK
ncbi:hypothetical protein H5410_031083 [Solanum commersonii]|uniref:Uncharacterized protein n=1 Tax=Solanum commersonii TaxID=4109 RepID=A0A9J5YHG6_SOLCO|nr:hypothetical protein H5410_031083 [Solanum commersonii]